MARASSDSMHALDAEQSLSQAVPQPRALIALWAVSSSDCVFAICCCRVLEVERTINLAQEHHLQAALSSASLLHSSHSMQSRPQLALPPTRLHPRPAAGKKAWLDAQLSHPYA